MFDLTWMQWVQVLSAALTVIIAFFGGWIAYQQMRTNRGSLKEKLFDRRLDVFKDVQIFLQGILREAAVSDVTWPTLHSARQRALFLFGEDVNSYLDEISERAHQMSLAIIAMQETADQVDRQKQIELKYEHLNWLVKQLDEMFEKFEPYLGFARHK